MLTSWLTRFIYWLRGITQNNHASFIGSEVLPKTITLHLLTQRYYPKRSRFIYWLRGITQNNHASFIDSGVLPKTITLHLLAQRYYPKRSRFIYWLRGITQNDSCPHVKRDFHFVFQHLIAFLKF